MEKVYVLSEEYYDGGSVWTSTIGVFANEVDAIEEAEDLTNNNTDSGRSYQVWEWEVQ